MLVRNFGRKKFDPRWLGPVVVTERKKFSVKIKKDNGQDRVVNMGDIKPYRMALEKSVQGAIVDSGAAVSSNSSSATDDATGTSVGGKIPYGDNNVAGGSSHRGDEQEAPKDAPE